MPSNLPTNDFRRLILSRQILSNAHMDRRRNRPLLPVKYEDAFVEVTKEFDELLKQTSLARSDYEAKLDRRNQLMPRLALDTRSFIACLKFRLKRGVISEEIHAQYRVQPARQRPHGPRERGWVLQASWLLEGEAWAQEHGYPPMVEPDAASLRESLELARAAMEASDAAEAHWARCQTKLREVRVRLMKQLSRIQWALKSELEARDHRPEYIRRILHRYGFRSRRPPSLPKHYFPWEQVAQCHEFELEEAKCTKQDLPPPFT